MPRRRLQSSFLQADASWAPLPPQRFPPKVLKPGSRANPNRAYNPSRCRQEFPLKPPAFPHFLPQITPDSVGEYFLQGEILPRSTGCYPWIRHLRQSPRSSDTPLSEELPNTPEEWHPRYNCKQSPKLSAFGIAETFELMCRLNSKSVSKEFGTPT